MPGLLRGVVRTAAVAGTATAVSNRVSRRQANRWQQQEYEQQPPEPQYAAPPPPPAAPAPDPIAQLRELGELKQQGILTEEERVPVPDELDHPPLPQPRPPRLPCRRGHGLGDSLPGAPGCAQHRAAPRCGGRSALSSTREEERHGHHVPAYPFWSLSIFALDVLIIYGLAAYGGDPRLAARTS
jgi:hypothetical protein